MTTKGLRFEVNLMNGEIQKIKPSMGDYMLSYSPYDNVLFTL
jgi:hypothetical protein